MKRSSASQKQKLPTVRESLANISHSLKGIEESLRDNRGDYAFATMVEALFDLAEYGPGKAPKGYYEWRHSE